MRAILAFSSTGSRSQCECDAELDNERDKVCDNELNESKDDCDNGILVEPRAHFAKKNTRQLPVVARHMLSHIAHASFPPQAACSLKVALLELRHTANQPQKQKQKVLERVGARGGGKRLHSKCGARLHCCVV